MAYEYRTGLTPLLLRLAQHYVTLGVGTHPCNSLGYDEVVVSVSREWDNHALPGDPPAYFMEFKVELYRDGRLHNWVEFKVHMTGGGGQPAFKVNG
jgi:hypothetical protein